MKREINGVNMSVAGKETGVVIDLSCGHLVADNAENVKYRKGILNGGTVIYRVSPSTSDNKFFCEACHNVST